MAKLMDSRSGPSAPANICLFDTPPSQVAFNKGSWMTYTPSNAVDSKGPYTFNVYDSANFFQLNKTYISFKLKLKNETADEKTAPPSVKYANFIGATFFDQVKVSFNSVPLYDSDHYAYKSYIQTLLGENDETKEGFLTTAGWNDPTSTDGRSLSSKSFLDLYAPLLLEPFQTERLLIPHVNIQIDLYRNKDAFCLETTTGKTAELEVSDMKLHMRAIDVVSSATIALENRLRTTPAQYPFTQTVVKVIGVSEGRFELPFNTIFHDHVPRRIIVGLLSPEISISKDSLKFDHFDVSEIQLNAAGTMYPPQPIQCDFDNKDYAQTLARLYEELGCVSNKTCPKITYKMFRNGFTFFVFNIAPIDTSNSWEMIQTGSTQLLMRFKKKVPTGGVNVMILAQSDAMFTLDRFRNVTVFVDVCLSSHLMEKFGRLDNLSAKRIQDLNQYLLSINILKMWNSCNGLPVDTNSELSLDATPRNHSFLNMVIQTGQGKKSQYSTIQKYFNEKYKIRINYPNSPLLRDRGGRMYPIETVWFRLFLY
ncbi:hypothetical protein CRE_22980 [Caenorhabditis remanei]|uniref:Uncharacterized protein n=1 Tax=Caenorhabditis remanei TaxID=31234 RepID=E3MW58_CAERE|nr:hypothetical protein CRE_22980 [Caenorhabditis remanei]